MADRLSNVQLLLMLSEDNVADNQDWSREVWKEGEARARKVLELIGMLDKAKGMLVAEYNRLKVYLPEEPMPKIVQKGPADEPVQRKDGNQRGVPGYEVHR
jgi:hypothetical protein